MLHKRSRAPVSQARAAWKLQNTSAPKGLNFCALVLAFGQSQTAKSKKFRAHFIWLHHRLQAESVADAGRDRAAPEGWRLSPSDERARARSGVLKPMDEIESEKPAGSPAWPLRARVEECSSSTLPTGLGSPTSRLGRNEFGHRKLSKEPALKTHYLAPTLAPGPSASFWPPKLQTARTRKLTVESRLLGTGGAYEWCRVLIGPL